MIQYLNEGYKQGMAKTYFCLCAAGPMPDIVNHFHFPPLSIDMGSESLSGSAAGSLCHLRVPTW